MASTVAVHRGHSDKTSQGPERGVGRSFEWPALKAAEKLRYTPRKNKKKKVNTSGIRNWYWFDYEDFVWDMAARKCR